MRGRREREGREKEREKGGRRRGRREGEEKGIIETRGERGKKREKETEKRGTCSLVPLALLTGTHHERHERWARDLREK